MSGTDPVDPAVARLLDDPAVWAEVSTSLRDRVLAEALAGEGHEDGAGDGGAVDLGGGAGDELGRRRASGRSGAAGRRGARPVWARPGLLAAAAVVVVGLVVAGGLLATGDDDPAGTEVALAGTEALPEGAASAELVPMPAGVEVRLDVSGLPPAPEGTFYEAWAVGEQGKVSAGTFHARGDQDEVVLWLGVDPDDYDALTVTRQPVDGGTVAQGEVVLRGEL
ncbi:MAG TPA: anti-sigma factor [Acidimicrobiales bacterium]